MRSWPWISSVAVALLLGGATLPSACDRGTSEQTALGGLAEVGEPDPARAGYSGAVDDARRAVAKAERLVAAAPESWIRRGQLAARYLDLARLTGSYEAFGHADAAVTEAFRLGDGHLGPNLVRARLSFALHRFQLVDADLSAAERLAERNGDGATLSEIFALRGRLALERGQDAQAAEWLERAVAVERTFEATAALADLHARRGDRREARALYLESAAALGDDEHQSHAWLELQLGELALSCDGLADARAHFVRADAQFPGWWLIEQHLAALDALEGHTARAAETYERLVAETGDPESMDALAALIVETEPQRAARLVERARAVYEARRRSFPEATYGHALEHHLAHEEDAEAAVELAERNHAERPNVEAATLLAEVYLRTGRVSAARQVLDAAVSGARSTAKAHEVYAVALERSNDPGAADLHRSLAARLRSDACTPGAGLD